ncbi:Cupin 1 [Cynara cardunculus var. scolymus]|uniref:Cupin 1 n=1 Tax=Cynara cardunculus var. scolymus TaxID=59895 RepID=A0A103Y592_CYNCS|nr:Cupin 1 [Cynara cardunculus var. scolymus]
MATIWLLIHVLLFYLSFPNPTSALGGGGGDVKEGGGGYFPVPATAMHGTLVKRDQRWLVASSAFGEITAVKMSDGKDGFYHLQFITMEPGSLFLPVHLHSDMVFFVDSGNGTLSWTGVEQDYGELRQVNLQAGDVYRLRSGSFFYLQNNLEFDRQKLRINAIFSDSKEELLV